MVNRLDSVVVAIEKQDNPVIIVSHQVRYFSFASDAFVLCCVEWRRVFLANLRVFVTVGERGMMTCPRGGCPREAS